MAKKTEAVKKAIKKISTEEVRGLTIYPPKHPKVKKLQEETEIHGDKVWFSSYFIMDWLDAHPLAPRTKVLEIGSGWGLLGMYCAKNFKAKVLATDADSNVFPLLELHSKVNDINLKTKTIRYEEIKQSTLSKHELVLGADICFWDELVDPLHELIKNALSAGVKQIIIADPGRSPFLRLARRCRKLYKASLRQAKVKTPKKHEGYLLIIDNNG